MQSPLYGSNNLQSNKRLPGEMMRIFSFVSAISMTTRTALLVALLASSQVQAHVVMVDPMPRSPQAGLTEDPCGGIPAGESVATYTAGTNIEITINLLVQHTQSLHAFISYDNFATRTELAMTSTSGSGIYTMTVPLPMNPLGSAVLQVVHENYVSCADITLSNGAVFAINAGLNDAWVNLDTLGQGFFFNVFPVLGKMFVAMFTYDTVRQPEGVTAMLGGPGQRWVTGFGDYADNLAILNLELTTGGIFNSILPEPGQDQGYGTFTIVFTDCNHATLTYDIPSLELHGVIELSRATPDNVDLCEALNLP